jgi:UMP-CMP kinase
MYLGCPGASKGTLCSKLTAEYNGRHLSVGDLLRATILNKESTERRELTPYIRSGSLVPPAMLLRALRRFITQNIHETSLFLLIDGFPRLLQ